MRGIHGGDIYGNHVSMDFSVNVNPLGMPDSVEKALYGAVDLCKNYPDVEERQLRRKVGSWLMVPDHYLLFGNGASELFMAVVHAVKPQKTLIPVPSFYGYEHAAGAADGKVVYYPWKEQEGYLPGGDFMEALAEDVELLFLANPNNPTGRMMDRNYLIRLLNICRQKRITVVLDECFIEFSDMRQSMISEMEEYENLLIVRAFTKIYAIPGVRIGYLLCSDDSLRNKIKRQLPEWNLSAFAQAAGCACAEQSDFVAKTVDYVTRERQFLADGLRQLGLQVFPSEANFILVRSEIPLYEKLLDRGILIRDCENFRGLARGYYRIAVKSTEDNERLLKVIGELK